jgi:hypothetical protein
VDGLVVWACGIAVVLLVWWLVPLAPAAHAAGIRLN